MRPGLGGPPALPLHVGEEEVDARELTGGGACLPGGGERPGEGVRRFPQPARGGEQLPQPLEGAGMIGGARQRVTEIALRLPQVAALKMQAGGAEQGGTWVGSAAIERR